MILDRSTLLFGILRSLVSTPPSCVDLLKKHLTHLHRHGSISLQRAVTSVTLGGNGLRLVGESPISHCGRREFPSWCARTINSAGLPSNGRRGESSDHRQFLCASPPSSRTDRGILTL